MAGKSTLANERQPDPEVDVPDGSDGSPPKPPKSEPSDLLPKKGERVLSIGVTGSGKTQFNKWLLERLPYDGNVPVMIYDTKHDPKFDELPDNRVVHSISAADAALEDLSVDYVIMRPPPAITSDARLLDRILVYHEEYWRGVDAYIDEMYHFHRHGNAGPGLNGLYTRGRSRGITTIGSTQRPAWVSGFVFSETQLFYVFPIYRKSDKKRVDDFIDGFDRLPTPEPYHFYLYRQGSRKPPVLMPPVPIDPEADAGYTDHQKEPETADPDLDREKDHPKIWL